jgi:putative aminopeptidase FrvX
MRVKKMDSFKLLQKLTDAPGPSGFEQATAVVIQELWQPHVDSITVDRLNSVIATKKGEGDEPRPRLLIAAHLDEIGLMVAQIEEKYGFGYLRLTPLGGVDRRQVMGQMVELHGSRPLVGVLGGLPASRPAPSQERLSPTRPNIHSQPGSTTESRIVWILVRVRVTSLSNWRRIRAAANWSQATISST